MGSKLATFFLLFALQLAFILLQFGGGLGCGSDNSADTDKDEVDITEFDESQNLTALNNRCYSCAKEIATGDECGSALLSGVPSLYLFKQDFSGVTATINNQFVLSGSYQDGKLNLSNNKIHYSGPGCPAVFNDVQVTAAIPTIQTMLLGWSGDFTFELVTLAGEEDCGDLAFVTCKAVHELTCVPTSSCSN